MKNCPYCGLVVIESNVKDNCYSCLCGSLFKNNQWEKKGETLKVEGVDENGKYKKANIYND